MKSPKILTGRMNCSSSLVSLNIAFKLFPLINHEPCHGHCFCHTYYTTYPTSGSSSYMALEQLWGDTPRPRAKEKPQQDGRRSKITFRLKPHTFQRCSEGSNIPCAHWDPETPQRLRQNCVWVSPAEVQVNSGLLQGQGLWVQQTWVWHKASWRRSPLTLP